MQGDPETGERYDDVIVFWTPSEADKQAMVQDEASVVALTGSRKLVALHRQLMVEARLATLAAGRPDGEIVIANHRQFVDLLRAGEIDAACGQLKQRMDVARERLFRTLPD